MKLLQRLLIVQVLLAPQLLQADEAVDFNRQVRPILAAHCFKCHGPDEGKREAGLRLDVREAAIAETESRGRAIVPGDPGNSELMRRISSEDGDEQMPPPAANKPLSDAQKQILRRWVASGAEYRPHWAFVPPQQARLPKVEHADWPRNAIDHFVLARMESAGLAPSPQADKYTLIRRVSLDLIGLPPTPEEADAFVADTDPRAYEHLVERLLASPHYGERWARLWLDLARYGDTNGYEKDDTRSIWPYRDWVIRALNADMPFDRFSIEQLAGDMLPDASTEQRIATGFHRNSLLNQETGVDPLEYRFYAMVDRVNTTGTTWLGLTLGCAQCHTHKFDPIPHRDYYRFLALLNNAEEIELEVPQPDLVDRRAHLTEQIASLEQNLASQFPLPPNNASKTDDSRSEEVRRQEHLQQKFEAWRSEAASRAVRWQVLRPARMTSNLPLLTLLDDDSVLASGDQTKKDVYELTLTTDLPKITALRLEALLHERLPNHGPGRVSYDFKLGEFQLSDLSMTVADQPVKWSGARQTQGNASYAIDADSDTGWSVGDGVGSDQTALFTFAEPHKTGASMQLRMLFQSPNPVGLGRFRVSVTSDPLPQESAFWPAEIEALLTIPEASLTPPQRQQLTGYYLSVAPEMTEQNAAIAKLRKELPGLPTTLIMSERRSDQRRPTFLHHRGEYLQPKDSVEADVLSVLPPLPSGEGHTRLDLARWLVSASNPLVGRVTMNRQWSAFFGQGLVHSTDDFGYQGEPPTHPELLDWLAVEFLHRGWSIKQMQRLIVTSATYQQSSATNSQLLAQDPANKLLARGPRHRLDAELIRDSALRASGLLSDKLGGPSVFPPQPDSVTEGAYGSIKWPVSSGEDRYRRGLYTFAKRTAPFAMLNVFDAPSGNVCISRREISNSPLQSLTLLNDQVFSEAAQALGSRIAERSGTVEEKANYLFRCCLTRPPHAQELARLVAFYHVQKQRVVKQELNASEIAGSTNGDVAERAVWTTLATAVLNLDEMINKE